MRFLDVGGAEGDGLALGGGEVGLVRVGAVVELEDVVDGASVEA